MCIIIITTLLQQLHTKATQPTIQGKDIFNQQKQSFEVSHGFEKLYSNVDVNRRNRKLGFYSGIKYTHAENYIYLE